MTEPVVICFDARTVTVDAAQRALYAVADLASGDLRLDGDEIVCRLIPTGPADPERLEHRMRHEVVDQVLRARIAEETAGIRNLVFSLAFSRTGLGDQA